MTVAASQISVIPYWAISLGTQTFLCRILAPCYCYQLLFVTYICQLIDKPRELYIFLKNNALQIALPFSVAIFWACFLSMLTNFLTFKCLFNEYLIYFQLNIIENVNLRPVVDVNRLKNECRAGQRFFSKGFISNCLSLGILLSALSCHQSP